MRGIYWDGQHFFLRSPAGQQLRMPAEAEADLQGFLELFRVKFGRDPGPGDPIVFDPRKDTPVPMPDAELDAGVRELVAAMATHPAHKHAHEQLGFVLTAENARFSRPEDIAKWNAAVKDWCAEHPEVPPPPPTALSIQPVRPAPRHFAPEYAAAQEALAHAVHLEEEAKKLVIAVLMVEKGATKQRVRVHYWHAFIQARRQAGHRWFEPRWALRTPTLYAFQGPAKLGWVPVALVFGDEGPACQFQPILAGVAVVKPDLEAVYCEGMGRVCALLEGKGEPGD